MLEACPGPAAPGVGGGRGGMGLGLEDPNYHTEEMDKQEGPLFSTGTVCSVLR